MNFEEYLVSKKINTQAFAKAEPLLWSQWKIEFEQMHPNSFTLQKLNLINPIRRKYPLPLQEIAKDNSGGSPVKPSLTPGIAKPVFKPKPKTS